MTEVRGNGSGEKKFNECVRACMHMIRSNIRLINKPREREREREREERERESTPIDSVKRLMSRTLEETLSEKKKNKEFRRRNDEA